MEKVGLLAGIGKLPVECARVAEKLNLDVYAVALLAETDKELKDVAAHYTEISVGQLGQMISYLKENGITKVTMIGKVTKEYLFNGKVQPDAQMMQLIMGLNDRNDDTIMLAFVKELAKEGIGVLDQTALIKALMPPKGVITRRAPTAEEKSDMEFGFKVAKELGRLDIGQTVVVKNLAVMAVEAIEGTDACIKRGGMLARSGATVVKTAKPNQDNRFDVPTIGEQTILSMIDVRATTLAFEAGATLLVNREKVVALADENDIAIEAI